MQSVQGNVDRELRKQELTKNIAISKKSVQQRILKRKNNLRLHQNDSTSVAMKVDLLRKEAYNPIVLFRPKEQEGENVFMLGIMTESQKKLLLKWCGKILIVDDTHSVTQYKNMRLLNVLISDENNKGWPVAHLVSNSMTSDIVHIFFKALKMKIEEEGDSLQINCIITDDDPALINGIEKAMQATIPHILCQWHLDKNFKKNLRSKCNESQFEEIYTDIKTIVQSSNIMECDALINGFINKHKASASAFVEYICSNYLERKEKWALCYRQFLAHGNINTTAHVESFHNRLKKVYFNRIRNKRMDDLLNILLTVEKDDYDSRARASLLGLTKNTFNLTQPHVDGLLLPDNVVEKIMDDLWNIKSLEGNRAYYVQQLVSSCVQDLCFDKCSSPSCNNLCSHIYLCSCPAEIPLCKHVHKLHSLNQRGIVLHQISNQQNEEEPVQFCSMSLMNNDDQISKRVVSEDNCYQKLEGDLMKLLEMVRERSIPTSLVTNVTTEVSDILTKCSSLASTKTDTMSLPDKETIGSNQKLVTQEKQTINPFMKKFKKKQINPEVIKKKKEEAKDNLLLYSLD
uniref:MULE transposase domain-containing protein n=2 Tax=Cacopsylla melanoneura TaxID=428564 RepID=A0A8D8TG13_9HEMI